MLILDIAQGRSLCPYSRGRCENMHSMHACYKLGIKIFQMFQLQP